MQVPFTLFIDMIRCRILLCGARVADVSVRRVADECGGSVADGYIRRHLNYCFSVRCSEMDAGSVYPLHRRVRWVGEAAISHRRRR